MEAVLRERIHHRTLEDKHVSAETAVSWIKDGMTVELSGFAGAGSAKIVPLVLVEKAKKSYLKLMYIQGHHLALKYFI